MLVIFRSREIVGCMEKRVAGIYLASKQCEWNVFGSTRVAYSDEIKFNIVYSGSRCYSKCVLIDSNKIIRFIRIFNGILSNVRTHISKYENLSIPDYQKIMENLQS